MTREILSTTGAGAIGDTPDTTSEVSDDKIADVEQRVADVLHLKHRGDAIRNAAKDAEKALLEALSIVKLCRYELLNCDEDLEAPIALTTAERLIDQAFDAVKEVTDALPKVTQ